MYRLFKSNKRWVIPYINKSSDGLKEIIELLNQSQNIDLFRENTYDLETQIKLKELLDKIENIK
jgi:hypothetical protein